MARTEAREHAHGRTIGLRLLIGALLVAATGLAAPSGAAVAPLRSTPPSSWQIDGKVYATAISGHVAYVGGKFKNVLGPNGQSLVRHNLAAFDLRTGAPLLNWDPDAGSIVRALAVAPGWLYVGGGFEQIGGQPHDRLGRVSLSTGAVDARFRPAFPNTVRALKLVGGDLFVGGIFRQADAVPVRGLAKINATTGALFRKFRATTNGKVFALAYSRSRNQLYVGGGFTRLSGATRYGLGAVNGLTGRISGHRFTGSATPTFALAMDATGSMLFAGAGGRANSLTGWRIRNGHRVWSLTTLGDVQALARFGPTLYFGFHDGFRSNRNVKALAVTAHTGRLSRTFRPRIGGFWGVYAISASSAGVVLGGAFHQVAGVPAQHWVRFLRR